MSNKDVLKSYSLNVDFLNYDKKRDVTKNIVYSEGDINTAFLYATLTMGGEIIDLTGLIVTVSIKNNEGEQLINGCEIVNAREGKISIPFTSTALSKVGFNKFEIVIYNGDKKLVSPQFVYRVADSVLDDGAVEDSNSYDVLLVLISQVQGALINAEEATGRVEALEQTISANEEERKTSETQRVNQENSRIADEITRQTQEEQRQSDFNAKISEINTLSGKLTTDVDNKILEIDTRFNSKAEEIVADVNLSVNNKTTEKFKEVDTILSQKLTETDSKVNEKLTEASTAVQNVNTKILEIETTKTQLVKDVNNKIVEVNTAKGDLTNTVNNKITEFENRFGELESANPSGELSQARASIDGTLHDSLSQRLQYDYDKKANKDSVYTKTEIDTKIDGITSVDDTVTSIESTWSSSKINSELIKKETVENVQSKVSQAVTESKKYTDDRVANLVGQSPELLDTLEELSQALGNDPNFATTVMTEIGSKVNKEEGKGLSTNDFTTVEKEKLATLKNYVHPSDANTQHVSTSQIALWNSKADGQHQHNYSDLQGLPTIPSIEGLASETYVNQKVASVVNSAPEALDTLQELANALGNDPNFSTTVLNEIGKKANSTDVYNKTETENKLKLKANSADVYTKAEVDIKIDNVISGGSDKNIAYGTTVTTSNWLVNGTDGHYVDIVHNLSTKRFTVEIVDTDTNEKVLEDYRIIDDNTIRVRNDSAINAMITVINGNAQTQIISAQIDDVNITTQRTWSSSKINSELEKTISGISTEAIGTSFDNSTNGMTATNVQEAIEENKASILEVKQSVSDGKAKVATAITGKGVSTGSDASFDTMASNIGLIKKAEGNAVASDVLSGKTFTNSNGGVITGTMANRGGSATHTPGTTNKTLKAGYYSGNQTIKGDANLVASNILSGKSIFGVAGNVIAGKRFASGTATVTNSNANVTVSGLAFKPSIVILGGKHSDPQIQQFGGIYFKEPWGTGVQYGVVSTSNGYRYSVGTSTASSLYVVQGGFKLRAYGDAAFGASVTWYAFE